MDKTGSTLINSYYIVYYRNLPEVKSTFKILSVPTVSARFGSDPFFWNWGMHTLATFLPTVSNFSFKIMQYEVISFYPSDNKLQWKFQTNR